MTAQSDLFTLRDFIRYATSSFNAAQLYYGHGTDNAWDEAVALVFHTVHLPHTTPASVLDARLTQEEKNTLLNLIQQRIEKRIPVPYLTHEAWFGELAFYVDERVLIPRSPIAELIEAEFKPWIDPDRVESILDLCTGSGCIAIACAKAFPEAAIDASDISKDALAVAKINVLRHNVEEQVQLFESNLFDQLPAKQYDIIVSNPPYVSTQEMFELPQEYRHEPELGLVSGTEGIDAAIRILTRAKEYLKPEGILVVEVGNSEYALAEKFAAIPFTWLEFERGGGGVFMLTKEQLEEIRL